MTFCCEQSFARDKNLRQAAAWQRQLAATAWLKDQLPPSFLTRSPLERASGDGAAADMTIVCRAAPSSLLSAPFGNAWLAVGDAACSYDPITSAGITKALLHGHEAGEALADRLATGRDTKLRAYSERILADFRKYAQLRAQLYASEQRFSDADFWRHRRGLEAAPKNPQAQNQKLDQPRNQAFSHSP